MEFLVYPRGFAILPAKIPVAAPGTSEDAMTVVALDSGGSAVKLVFGLDDWAQFQRAVADPEAFAAGAAARAKIVTAGGLAPSVRERKH